MTDRGATLDPGQLRARLIAVLTVLMTLVVALFGLATLAAFDRAIAPELENRTRLIGSILRSEIQRTLDMGVPLEALGGLDAHIEETIRDFEEVRRIAIVHGSETVIAEVRREETPGLLERSRLGELAGIGATEFAFPILAGNEVVGEIRVEGSPQFVETRLRDVFLDVSVLAIVALLLGVELALAVAAASVWKPYGRMRRLLAEQAAGRFVHIIRVGGVSGIRRAAERLNDQATDLAGRVRALPAELSASLAARLPSLELTGHPRRLRYSDFNDVRLCLFLFATGAEITASFLPVYARSAARPDWLSAELAAAAPLAVFLLSVALLSPVGGAIAARFGARRVFAASALPVAVALAGMGTAGSVLEVTLWRGVIGVFYALATIACQEYAIRASGRGEAIQSASAFVSMIFGGVFCGSVLGGVIAGRLGFPAALFAGAALALVSAAVAQSAMRGRAGESAPPAAAPVAAAGGTANGTGFAALLLCIAVPMSATTAVFIWYLTPLLLASGGYAPADVARIVMLYYLAATLIGPLARGLARGRAGSLLPVTAGAVVTGAALLSVGAPGDFWPLLLGVSGCGIGHALIRAPMTALAVGFSGGAGAKMNTLRFGERIGAFAGLMGSAFYLSSYPPQVPVAVMGAVSLGGGVAFSLVMFLGRNREGAQS